MNHSCPVCKTTLTGKVYDGVTFSECPQCAGVWIFEDDLKQLESENVQDLDRMDVANVPVQPVESPSSPLPCPECGVAMEQFHFVIDGPILLHRCSSCEGLWIDDGKLTQMAAAIEAANRPPTPEEIALANQGRTDAIFGIPPKNAPAPASDATAGTVPRAESAAEVQFDQEHAATMARYNAIASVCRVLSWGRPFWRMPYL